VKEKDTQAAKSGAERADTKKKVRREGGERI